MTIRFFEKDQSWDKFGYDVSSLIKTHISSRHISSGGWVAGNRSIEDEISTLAESVGVLSQILFKKGILSPEEVLKLIGINDVAHSGIEIREIPE